MIGKDSISNKTLDYYIFSDQPMTCGKCGSKTDFYDLNDELQKHQCLNLDCEHQFLAIEDAD